jgi:cobalamin synthase
MVAVVVVSGALHQDALADTADGLGGPAIGFAVWR